MPVDGLVEGDHLVAGFGGFDEPGVKRIVEDGFVGSPAVGVRVHVFLRAEETAVCLHLQTEVKIERFRFRSCGFIVLSVDSKLRIIGIFYPSAGILAVEFVVDVRFVPLFVEVFHTPVFTSEIDHRARSVVLGLHIETRHAGCVCNLLIVGTKSGRDMYYTGTIIGGDIVSRDDTECSFARIDPREERFVFESDEFGTFVASDDLRLQSFAFFVCPAEVFLISAQASLRKDDVVAGRSLHFYVVDFRSDAKSSIRRQRPRRRGPSDDVPTVFYFKAGGASQIFDVAVAAGLVELVGTQTRSRSG